jgi:hypothetical protein
MKAARFNQASVRDFEFTHGRKPKGFGLWSFQLHRGDGRSTAVEKEGTFTDAKHAALREARELGCHEVSVNT